MDQQREKQPMSSAPLVIVLAGPTGVGKSAVASRLCQRPYASRLGNFHRGHIISADSVQVYRGVNIGANKPSREEQKDVMHHLIDVMSPATDRYSAADWMKDAISVLEILTVGRRKRVEDDTVGFMDDDGEERSRRSEALAQRARESLVTGDNDDQTTSPVLPVIVGGTMMYLQWLVHGKPDAMKPSSDAVQKAESMVHQFQTSSPDEDKAWEQALQYAFTSLHPIFQSRIRALSGKDWYRYRRTLEVAFTITTDLETATTDVNHEKIHDLFTGQRLHSLRSLGYDVRCFFLCPDDRMTHASILDKRCEQMISQGLIHETAKLVSEGNLPTDGIPARAIGYRQTLEYLHRSNPKRGDEEAFESFLNDFMGATRRYAKKQMQWFRRDDAFMFIPVSTSESTAATAGDSNTPTATTTTEDKLQTVADCIITSCQLPKEEFEHRLLSSTTTKERNEEQGKKMKFFQSKRNTLIRGSSVYENALKDADQCTLLVQGLEVLQDVKE